MRYLVDIELLGRDPVSIANRYTLKQRLATPEGDAAAQGGELGVYVGHTVGSGPGLPFYTWSSPYPSESGMLVC